MSLAFNKVQSPQQIGNLQFWFDYFTSVTTEGDTASDYYKMIRDLQNDYELQPRTSTSTEEFQDDTDGFKAIIGSNMTVTAAKSNFDFLHQAANTTVIRVKHADVSPSTSATGYYYNTGRGNEQSITVTFDQNEGRRNVGLYNGGSTNTYNERPYEDNKYPVSIQDDMYFNIFLVVDPSNNELRFYNNGIITRTETIGALGVGSNRYSLSIGGTDTVDNGSVFTWSQFIGFDKVLNDSEIQQLNSFLNSYSG